MQREAVEADESPNAENIRNKFGAIVRRVYEVFSFGGNALQISTFVTAALEAGHIHL